MKLSDNILKDLDSRVGTPRYDRSGLSAGILHIGVGNFHRAHQAAYLEDLFNLGLDHDWAIVGAGIMPFDAARREALATQDWLGTVVEMSPGKMEARVTGAMIDFCEVDTHAIIERMADPAIRIVSLTITEGGYYIDATTDGFDTTNPDIVHDAANPETPNTVFGIILAALQLRHKRGIAAPAILSCDNLPENGHVTRQAVEGLAAMISPRLRDWVSENVVFPNSMVDRITPVTSESKRVRVSEELGIDDVAPVVCEPFRQWVMEDNFPLGRPALENVGVQFVPDVTPYETMKLRILNAGHATIAYPAALLGFECVHEAMEDADIAEWLQQLMHREVIPILEPIPGEDYHAYLATCMQRFANPEVRDTIERLCQDGSNRQPKFVLPTISEALAAGRPIEGLALEVALWCRYCATQEELDDPRAVALRRAAQNSLTNPHAFLELTEIFGPLIDDAEFARAFETQITRLWHSDTRTVLRDYLDQEAR